MPEPGYHAPDTVQQAVALLAGNPAGGTLERLAQTSYRLGGLVTGSGARLRLGVVADRLTVTAHPALMLVLSAERAPGRADPAQSLAAFRAAIGPLDGWMDRVIAGDTAAAPALGSKPRNP